MALLDPLMNDRRDMVNVVIVAQKKKRLHFTFYRWNATIGAFA